MSEKNPVKLFVTHAWEPHEDYLRVFEYLESTRNFYYMNLSDREDRPAGGEDALKNELRKQIGYSEILIVLSSIFDSHYDWVSFQVLAAKGLNKPVIAMKPFGGVADTPAEVKELADEVVEWNERSIVDAILRQARHEDTMRWEVIDFP